MLKTDLKAKLELHAQWLEDEDEGERLTLSGADLSGADLSGADLRRADLSGADLSDADLDFSYWPFRCGSFHPKADIRLVAQLAKHLAMLDVSLCCKGIQEAMYHFRQTGLAHLFDEFRNDLAKTPEE